MLRQLETMLATELSDGDVPLPETDQELLEFLVRIWRKHPLRVALSDTFRLAIKQHKLLQSLMQGYDSQADRLAQMELYIGKQHRLLKSMSARLGVAEEVPEPPFNTTKH